MGAPNRGRGTRKKRVGNDDRESRLRERLEDVKGLVSPKTIFGPPLPAMAPDFGSRVREEAIENALEYLGRLTTEDIIAISPVMALHAAYARNTRAWRISDGVIRVLPAPPERGGR